VIESDKPFTQALQVQLPLGVVVQAPLVLHVHATSHVGLFTVLLFNKTISFAEVRADYPQREGSNNTNIYAFSIGECI
jgi:hypothetical protein